MSEVTKVETGVELPDSGVIDTNWAKEQLERVNIFSQELMNYGRGQVFHMLRISLSDSGYTQAVEELSYTVPTAETYINYLDKRPVLEAIKEKYYVALSLSAAEYIPNSIEDALALCDIALAKRYGLTAEGLKKAAEATGTLPKKMTNAAITVEADKKKALNKWLTEQQNLTEEEIANAQHLHPEGKNEFVEKAIAAFDRLGAWEKFYSIIAEPIHKSNDPHALRFLSDMDEAAGSIMEYLKAEEAYHKLNILKEQFEETVYPEILYQASK